MSCKRTDNPIYSTEWESISGWRRWFLGISGIYSWTWNRFQSSEAGFCKKPLFCVRTHWDRCCLFASFSCPMHLIFLISLQYYFWDLIYSSCVPVSNTRRLTSFKCSCVQIFVTFCSDSTSHSTLWNRFFLNSGSTMFITFSGFVNIIFVSPNEKQYRFDEH